MPPVVADAPGSHPFVARSGDGPKRLAAAAFIIALLGLFGAQTTWAENLLRNASFESVARDNIPLGYNRYCPLRDEVSLRVMETGIEKKDSDDVELEDLDEETVEQKGWRLVVEEGKAYHGKVSFRTDLREGYTWATEVKGGWYTFSAYALSRSEEGWLQVTAEDIRGRKGEIRNRQDHAVQLSDKWKRCTFSFRVVRGPVTWTLETLGEGTVWVDAVQLEAGEKATPFQLHPWDQDPPKDLEERLVLDEPSTILPGLAPVSPEALQRKGKAGEIGLRIGIPESVPDRPIPASGGIPIPRGHLYNEEHVSLNDAEGKEVPLQTRVLSRHVLDGSIQMLLVDLQAPGPDATFRLTYGPDVAREAGDSKLSVVEKDDEVTVNTGPLKFTVRRESFNLLDSLWFDSNGDGGLGDDEQVIIPGKEQGVWTADAIGRMYWSSHGKPEQVTVEEYGPHRCCIAASGLHRSKQGQALFRYIVRIHAYAGKPYLRIEHVFSNEQPPYATVMNGAGVRFRLKPGLFDAVHFARDHKAVSDELDEVYFVHPDLIRKRTEEGVVLSKRLSDGWILAEGRNVALTAMIREMNWMPPKEIWFDPDVGLDLCVWPRHFTRGLCVPMGTARTHRLWLHFHQPGQAPEQHDRWLDLFRGESLVQADPEWYCDSAVFGQLAHFDDQRMPHFENMLRRKGDWVFGRFPRPGEYRWYDFITYGDDRGDMGWSNMETMRDHAMFLHYVRTLDPWYYRRAYDAAIHYRDVDICHPWGQCRVHCHNHTLLPWDGSHSWIKGVLDHYLLTGDPRSLEVANEHGRWIRTKPVEYEIRKGSRRFTRLLENMADLYRITGHREYLENFTARIDYAEQLRGEHKENSRFHLDDLLQRDPPRANWGQMGFPQFYAIEGVMQMAKATEEKRWIDMFREEMGFLVTNPDGPDCLKSDADFRLWGAWRGASMIGAESRNSVFAPCMNYLYDLTGDKRLIEAMLYATMYATTDLDWKDWYPGLGWAGLAWFTHALHYPLKWGLDAEQETTVREAARTLIIPLQLVDPGFELSGTGGNRAWATGNERKNLGRVYAMALDEQIRFEGKGSLKLTELANLDKIARKKAFTSPYGMSDQRVFLKEPGTYEVTGHIRWLDHGRPNVSLTIDGDDTGAREQIDLNLPTLLPERNYDDIKKAPKASAENMTKMMPGAEQPATDAAAEFEGPKEEIDPTDYWWRLKVAFETREPSTVRIELVHLLGLKPPGTVWFDAFGLKRLEKAPKELKKASVEMVQD